MSTAPSAASAGSPHTSELDAAKNKVASLEAELTALYADIHGSWLFHDLVVYGGMYLTLWLAAVPAGAGWDALIAAAPAAGMSMLRRAMGNQT